MAAHRYWRVKATAAMQNGGLYMACNELQFRTAMDGADAATGGVAIADSSYLGVYVASRAFDDSTGTDWISDGSGTAGYIGYDFGPGDAKEVVQVAYSPRLDSNWYGQAPTAVTIDHSDDGATWTVAAAVSGIVWRDMLDMQLWTVARDSGTAVDVTKVSGFAVVNAPVDRTAVTSMRGFAVLNSPRDRVAVDSMCGFALLNGSGDRVAVTKISAYVVINELAGTSARPVVFVAT